MLLYHYTTVDAAISIIKNGLCFWGFRYDSMNDPTDFVFARDNIMPRLIKYHSNCEHCDISNIYPYIVSFCKEQDYDIMWRLYRGEVAFVIDSDKFPSEEWNKEGNISENIFHNDVIYADIETIETVARELYVKRSDVIENDNIMEYQLSVMPFIKHKAYAIENEYRLAKVDYDTFSFQYNPDAKDNCEIIECENPKDIKCIGSKNGTLRLYKEFSLPKDSLVGLIFHTFDDKVFNLQKKHFELWLLQNGFRLNKIKIERTSSYPVR